jgi:hypothetical protein
MNQRNYLRMSEKMEGFCFVISITARNRPNVKKDDDISSIKNQGLIKGRYSLKIYEFQKYFP